MYMLDGQFLISHQITNSHRKQMTSSRFMAEIAVTVNSPLVLRPLCWVVGLFLHPAYEACITSHSAQTQYPTIPFVWNCIHGYHSTKQNIHHTGVLSFNEETYITHTYRQLSHPPPYAHTLSHIHTHTNTVLACVFIHKTAVLPEWLNPQCIELLTVTALNKLPQQNIIWNDTNPYERYKQHTHTCITPATSFFHTRHVCSIAIATGAHTSSAPQQKLLRATGFLHPLLRFPNAAAVNCAQI